MKPDPKDDYSHWSRDELRKAEATAQQFLEQHAGQIGETLRSKAQFLEGLIRVVANKKTTLDQRLDSFARISEIAQLLKQDADGFFELASQPVVARILLNTKK
ncbi:MAG: hypothetical protein U0Q18_27540 [Bryobacteraceae bacterium]